jgi:hypothetical protein
MKEAALLTFLLEIGQSDCSCIVLANLTQPRSERNIVLDQK